MLNLLIVDDEELIREEIKSKIIRLANPRISNIHLASNGLEAFKACHEFNPNIMISDIRMPDTDGLTLIRKCSTTYPSIKFIVLSGYGDYGYVREAFKYGVVDYLLKPVRLSELETQLNRAIDQCIADETEELTLNTMAEHSDKGASAHEQLFSNSSNDSNTLSNSSKTHNSAASVSHPKSLIGIVKQYIAERPYDNVTLTEVSNLVSMNYTYFSSWFKEETGWTFSAYMMRIKMEEAKRLLENPTLRVNEVASRVGYDNIYHFSRAFKNYTGLAPKEYRKQSLQR
ncbi:response regulator [Paenibacillus sp. ACRSA]|uniref:response regulator transcription factor n=1 Tax=Paenibacillus sp. ACRSA TaxID=2918211 RepID=UPI001EF7318F|nr:response regulator [Paenibacillus sp. ACRSA]MCG7378703.1 response regulator [Paenibacillus sp. ACRSA]